MKLFTYFGQLVLALLVAIFAAGPYTLQLGLIQPDWIALSVWLCVWFLEPRTAYSWAIVLGLVLDIISFRYIGIWIVTLLGLSYIVLYVRQRYLQVASLLQAVIMILFCTIVLRIFFLAINQSYFILRDELFRLLATIIWGIIIYYGVALRWRLFARWTGRRF